MALLVASFHGDAGVRPGWIDGARVVGRKKDAPVGTTGNDYPEFVPKFREDVIHGATAIVRIGLKEAWFAEDVEQFRLDEEVFAAGAALVALVGGHRRREAGYKRP